MFTIRAEKKSHFFASFKKSHMSFGHNVDIFSQAFILLMNMHIKHRSAYIGIHYLSPINNLSFTFLVFLLAVRTFMNHWLLMGHWLFQSQQEWGEGVAGSPRGTQTCGRSIIHGSPWACSEHWHPTCLNQTGPVSLMPLGKCEAQVKVGVRRVEGDSEGDGEGQNTGKRKGGRGEEEERE